MIVLQRDERNHHVATPAPFLKVYDKAPRIYYTVGSIPQTVFVVPFVYFADEDLKVYRDSVLQRLHIDYSVSGAGQESNRLVTFSSSVSNARIAIVRDIVVQRITDFPQSGPFDIGGLNSELDRMTAMLQEQRDVVDRSITLPEPEAGLDLQLPTAAVRANSALTFDADGNLKLMPVVGGELSPDAANINFTGTGTGAQTRSVQSRLRDQMSVLDFIPSAQHAAISNGSTTYDATADIQAAIDAASGGELHFPVGKFRVQELVRLTSATDQWRPGMKLVGQGRGTNLVGIASNKAVLRWDVGYTPDGTIGPTLKFTRDSEVRGMLITQEGGVTATDGMRFTAAWNVRVSNVWIEGMSGKALHVPFRSDIYAAVSDYWQCFSLEFNQCRFSESTDWGVYLGGGQSPGLWRMQFCTIANNAGGGVYDTTGQFIFTDNLIVGNGTFGANGGMLVDASVEGVSFNSLIERNEFDTNFNYHLWMLRVRNARNIGNRYLSQTYNGNTGTVLTSGSAFMRPATHVKLGDGSSKEVLNSLFEGNYHRSVTGAGPTTAAVSAYIVTPGSTEVRRNRFNNNDVGSRDGVNQNSSGMVRYSGVSVGNEANSIVDGNKVGLSVSASSATNVVGTMTAISFGNTIYDSHSAFASPNFTVPVAGRYRISATVQLNGLSAGNAVNLGIFVNGVSARTTQQYAGLSIQSFPIVADLLLAETDTVSIRALQNSGSGKLTTADSSTRLEITQES